MSEPAPRGVFDNERNWRVLFGPSSLGRIADEVAHEGGHRALIVAPRSLAESSLLGTVRARLGDRAVGVVESRAHGPLASIRAGAARLAELGADSIVSVGGGSAVDTAKGIAILACHGDLAPFRGRPTRRAGDLSIEVDRLHGAGATVPIVAVTTTMSGAEFTYQAGLTDEATGRKDQYYERSVLPRAIVLDPDATAETPRELWLSSGVKALDHAVERLYSRMAHPLSDAIALAAAASLFRYLPVSAERDDDRDARGHLLYAAWLAQFTTGNVNVGVGHAVDHQLCARYDLPHGIAACIMLPHAMAFNRHAAAAKLARLARAAGASHDGADGAIEAVRALVRRLGLPARLRDVGVGREHFDLIAERALTDTAITGNPRPVESAAEVRRLLDEAW